MSYGTVQAPPGMWRPTDFTDEQHEVYGAFRQSFFDILVQNLDKEMTWAIDQARTRLCCNIHGGEYDKGRDPLELLIYFCPSMNPLFVQMSEFRVRPEFIHAPDTLEFIREKNRLGGCRIKIIEEKKNICKVRVSSCLDVPLAGHIAPFIRETLMACDAVTFEALFLRTRFGAVS